MVHLVTGYSGSAHIMPQNHANMNQKIVGNGAFVFGGSLNYEKQSDTRIKIYTEGNSIFMAYGRQVEIDEEVVTITAGTAGKFRTDYIALVYRKDLTTGVETTSIEVIKGTEYNTAASVVPPTYSQEEITNDTTFSQIPLFCVNISETAITSIDSMCPVVLDETAKEHYGNTAKHTTMTEKENWNDANSKKHEHSNKSILDGITSASVQGWNAASSKAHEHSNKAVLDNISAIDTVLSSSSTNPVQNKIINSALSSKATVETGTFKLLYNNALVAIQGTYCKVGKIVYCYGSATAPAMAAYTTLTGLPYAVASPNDCFASLYTTTGYYSAIDSNLVMRIKDNAVLIDTAISENASIRFVAIYMTN